MLPIQRLNGEFKDGDCHGKETDKNEFRQRNSRNTKPNTKKTSSSVMPCDKRGKALRGGVSTASMLAVDPCASEFPRITKGVPPAKVKRAPPIGNLFSSLWCDSIRFLDSESASMHSPEVLRAETLRRMELMVLHILSHICDASIVLERPSCAANTRLLPPRQFSISSSRLREWYHLLVCLPLIYQNVHYDISVTQRDLFYHLIRRVRDQKISDSCVRRLCQTLKVPRSALHVVAGQRGSIGGCISQVFVDENGNWNTHSEQFATGGSAKRYSQGLYVTDTDIPIPVEDNALRVLPWGEWPPHIKCVSPRCQKRKIDSTRGNVSPAVAQSTSVSLPNLISGTSHLPSGDTKKTQILKQTENSFSSFVQSSPLLSSYTSCLRVSPPLFYLSPATRAVIVIEKYTVYHRLMQERCCDLFPCILLTSQGYPTRSARRLLASIAVSIRGLGSETTSSGTTILAQPRPLLLALADFNPSGVSIIHQYKLGSASQGRVGGEEEMEHCRVPDLRWIGVRSHHVLVQSARCGSRDAKERPSTPPGRVGLQPVKRVDRPPPSYYSSFPYTCFTPRDDALMKHLVEDVETLQTTYQEMLQEYIRQEHVSNTRQHSGSERRAGEEGEASPPNVTTGVGRRPSSGDRKAHAVASATGISMEMASASKRCSAHGNRRRHVDQWRSLALDLASCSCYQPLSSNSSRTAMCTGATPPPLFIEKWYNELLVMQSARMKIEIDTLIDHPCFHVGRAGMGIEDAAARPMALSHSDPSTRIEAQPECNSEERCLLTPSHACPPSRMSSSHACLSSAISSYGDETLNNLKLYRTPTDSRLESSRPLSEWLYQRILSQDYL